MTRFARKEKVQGSMRREPEEATPWSEMVATIKPPKRNIEEDDDYMEGVEEGGDPPDHVVPAVDQSSDEESDENTDMLVAKVEKPVEELDEEEEDYDTNVVEDIKQEDPPKKNEELVSGEEPKKKKKKRKKGPLKCLMCGSKEHKKMYCEQLPEERRKELQELYQMKVERKGKGTGRKKNKNKDKNRLPYEGTPSQSPAANKENDDKKKKKNKKKFVKEVRDRSGAVVEAGEAIFQGFRVKADDKVKLEALQQELKSKGLSKTELEGAMKRERRIAEKKLARAKKLVCFKCRQPGHMLADCPEAAAAPGDEDVQRPSTGICFKCGSLEHISKDCSSKQKREGAYNFANCFICKQDGHLAKACPDNPKGLYPKGGGCVFCGSVEHLKRDCKRKIEKDLSAGVKVGTMGDSVEDEPVYTSHTSKPKKKKKESKKEKVVAF